jgi:hypothetical protein
VDAIKQASGILIRVAKTFHQEDEQRLEEQGLGEGYRDQLEPDGPLQYGDGVRPWIAEILTEACGGLDGDLIEAYCEAFNFMHAEDLCRATKNEKALDREFSRIGEHPLPNKA